MKNIKSFILGAITTAMLGAITVSALAVANVIEINTNVKIMVNGTAFAPKDKNGKDALVFIYDGTTYAPLRAIADAYGLNIGYDDNSRMVTVGKQGAIQKPETKPEITPEKWSDEDEKAYQEFKAMWTVERSSTYKQGTGVCVYYANYIGNKPATDIIAMLGTEEKNGKALIERYQGRYAQDVCIDFNIKPTGDTIVLRFLINGTSHGQSTWIPR